MMGASGGTVLNPLDSWDAACYNHRTGQQLAASWLSLIPVYSRYSRLNKCSLHAPNIAHSTQPGNLQAPDIAHSAQPGNLQAPDIAHSTQRGNLQACDRTL